jgi:signal transduction histidine kinase
MGYNPTLPPDGARGHRGTRRSDPAHRAAKPEGRVFAHRLILTIAPYCWKLPGRSVPLSQIPPLPEGRPRSRPGSQPQLPVKKAPPSPGDSLALVRSYRSALKKHLQAGGGSDRKYARRIGQRALALGLDILGLARIHELALAGLEPDASSPGQGSVADHQHREFFETAVSHLEEGRLAISGAISRRTPHAIEALKLRTEDLVATNAELHLEIARRIAVEESLRTSEATTSLLLKKSRRLQEDLRSLSRRLLTVQEDERRRISRELHDVVAQALAGINVRLAVLRSQSSANVRDFEENIKVTERLVEQSVEIVHRFASDLRPMILDDLGIIPALQSYLKAFQERTQIPAKLTAASAVERLDPPARTALYRIAQEALANISRHASPGQVTIDLRPGKTCVRMRIRDDGQGFDSENHDISAAGGHLGLLGMQERAEMVGGSLRIESKEGRGTTVLVEVPLPETTLTLEDSPDSPTTHQ